MRAARETFEFFHGGQMHTVAAGDLRDDDDVAVQVRPAAFGDPTDEQLGTVTCDDCDFVAASPGGLATHRRVHDDD